MRAGRAHRAHYLPAGLEAGKQIQRIATSQGRGKPQVGKADCMGTNCWRLSVDNGELQTPGAPAWRFPHPCVCRSFPCRAQCDSHRKRQRKINPTPCFLQEKRGKDLFKSCTSGLLRKICSLQKAAAKVCHAWGVIRVSLTCWRRNQQPQSGPSTKEEKMWNASPYEPLPKCVQYVWQLNLREVHFLV